jgi:hypothetical protein
MMYPRFLHVLFKVSYPQHVCRGTYGIVDLKHIESSAFRTLKRGVAVGREPMLVPFFPNMLVSGEAEEPVAPDEPAVHIDLEGDQIPDPIIPDPIQVVLPQDAPSIDIPQPQGVASDSLSYDIGENLKDVQDEAMSHEHAPEVPKNIHPDSIKLIQVSEENRALREELKFKEKEIKKLEAELNKKDKKLKSVTEDHERVLQEKNDEILKLTDTITDLEEKLDMEKALLGASYEEIALQVSIIESLKDKIKGLSGEVKSLKRKRGDMVSSDSDSDDDDSDSPPWKKAAYSVVGDEIITYEESHVVVTNRRQAYNQTVVDVGDSVQFADLMPDNVEEFFVHIPLEDVAPSCSTSSPVPNIAREILMNRRILDEFFLLFQCHCQQRTGIKDCPY